VADDRTILRDLARQWRAIADDPATEALRKRWRRHNALKGDKPMVVVWPEGGWSELLPDSALLCQDPFHRAVEWDLRAKLYTHNVLKDDTPLDPWFYVNCKVSIGGYGLNIPFTQGDRRGSFIWDPPIKDFDYDLAKIQPRQFAFDQEKTRDNFNRVGDLVGDILPPRFNGSFWWTVGLTQDAAYLLGMENLMLAMVDQPEKLHQLMAFLRDDCLRMITWAEKEGFLTSNGHAGHPIGSGGYGGLDELIPPDAHAGLHDRWGFAESQETVGISPGMFEEFILPYQIPLLEKFAINCYGCCEGVEHRIDLLLKYIPRLRRVSVAPAANQEILAEKLRGKCIFSRKPQPGHVCLWFNEKAIREDLRHTLRLAGAQPLEFILKDTHTTQNEPWRLARWVEIARDEIERHYERS